MEPLAVPKSRGGKEAAPAQGHAAHGTVQLPARRGLSPRGRHKPPSILALPTAPAGTLAAVRRPSGRVAQRPQPAPLRTARHSRHRERHPGRCSPQRAPRCHRTELPPRKHGFSGRNEQIHHVKETLPGRPTLNSRPRAAPCPALPWPYLRGPGARCGRPGARSGSRRRRKASPTWARLGGRPETPERGRSGAAGNTRAGGTETPERVRVSRAAGRWWRLSAHPSASPLDNAANQHLVLQSRGARAALQADSREGVAEGRTGRTSRK